MWGHFSVVARPMWHPYFKHGQFSTRWSSGNQIKQKKTKKLEVYLKTISKNSAWSCCVTPVARRCPTNPILLALLKLILVWYLLLAVKLLKSYYMEKPFLTTTQGLSKNFRLKFLCDIIFPLFPDQSHSPCFTKEIFNEMATLGRQTFQIMLNWIKKLYLHPKTYYKK